MSRRPASVAQAQKPSLGLGIICKDGEKTLPKLLDSIMPYVRQCVVALDDRTTDRTAKIARKYGAEVHPFEMCTTHQCPSHAPFQAQHFAKARNFSFSKLDPSLDFWCWLDADDVIHNGQYLPALLANTPPGAIGTWFEYVYAYAKRPDGSLAPTTIFHRERILRTKVDGMPVRWEWKYRVHEVCAPEGLPGDYQGKWLVNNEIKVIHQDGAHKTESSAPRNLALLEIDYEENPRDARVLFYLGNQFFAMGRWREAAFWYEKLLDIGENPYERWQAQLYACKAYQRLGYLEHALRMAFGVLHTFPQHHEAYYSLCEVYSLMQEDGKVEFWTKMFRSLEAAGMLQRPPFFVFANPMDVGFNSFMPIADAYQRMGRITDAKMELQQAYRNFPDERVAAAIQMHERTEADIETANSFVRIASLSKDPATIIRLYEALPNSVKSFGRVRDCALPVVLAQRAGVVNGHSAEEVPA